MKKADDARYQTWDPKLRKMRQMTQEEIARAKKNQQDAKQGRGEGTPQHKKGGEIKKECGGSKVVAKFKAAKCGSKLKKHLQGGKLGFKF